MARFLTTTETSAVIERVIREAEKELTLISAYVYPKIIYIDRLKDAAARGVRIRLMFGKQKMDDRVRAQFEQVPNLEIYFLDELHAKCYLNERNAVVTSLNLLNSSEALNREMGVLLNCEQDAKAYVECVREVESILAAATPISRTKPTSKAPAPDRPAPTPAKKRVTGAAKVVPAPGASVGALPVKGFCIRCGKSVPCDPDAPLCYEDFTVWVRYKDPDYIEARCHTCGGSAFVTMADPMCNTCNKRYDASLRALDAQHKEGKIFGRPTWRKKR